MQPCTCLAFLNTNMRVTCKPAAATSIESFLPPANQPNKLLQHKILTGETAAGRDWQTQRGLRSEQVGTSARGCTAAYKAHKGLMHP